MRLKQGDIIAVRGFVMLAKLDGGRRYRVKAISTHGGRDVYDLALARGRKTVVRHYASSVDDWIGDRDLNGITILRSEETGQ